MRVLSRAFYAADELFLVPRWAIPWESVESGNVERLITLLHTYEMKLIDLKHAVVGSLPLYAQPYQPHLYWSDIILQPTICVRFESSETCFIQRSDLRRNEICVGPMNNVLVELLMGMKLRVPIDTFYEKCRIAEAWAYGSQMDVVNILYDLPHYISVRHIITTLHKHGGNVTKAMLDLLTNPKYNK